MSMNLCRLLFLVLVRFANESSFWSNQTWKQMWIEFWKNPSKSILRKRRPRLHLHVPIDHLTFDSLILSADVTDVSASSIIGHWSVRRFTLLKSRSCRLSFVRDRCLSGSDHCSSRYSSWLINRLHPSLIQCATFPSTVQHYWRPRRSMLCIFQI